MTTVGDKKKLERIIIWLLSAAIIGLLLYTFWIRFRIGQIRYFDSDEFAYLHWVHNLLGGKSPYVDFLFFVTPGFLVYLVPAFWLGKGIELILWGRVLAFFAFLILDVSAMWLYRVVRGNWGFLWMGLLLSILPLPFDRMLEIRPDTLAMGLFVLGMIGQAVWLRRRGRWAAVWSGLFYGLSILVMQKMFLSLAWAGAIWVAGEILTEKNAERKFNLRKLFAGIGYWVLGLTVPAVMFLGWAGWSGHLSWILYSVVKLPFEVNGMGEHWAISPWHFFGENDVFYGHLGSSLGYVGNLVMWTVGAVVAVLTLISLVVKFVKQILSSRVKPRGWFWTAIMAWNAENRALVELMILGVLAAQTFSYVYLTPLRHPQYLIPMAVFVCWYVADLLMVVWKLDERSTGGILVVTALISIVIYGSWVVFDDAHLVKLTWGNDWQLADVKAIWATIPSGEKVFDLEGISIVYDDAYYVTAFPYGQFAQYLSVRLPSLGDSLVASHNRFVVEGRSDRLSTIPPEDKAYITGNYQKIGNGIWEKAD